MKRPAIANIPEPTPETSFTERARVAKKKALSVGSKAVRKSYSLTQEDVSYIEKLALELGMERGKSMNDSEALRTIIDQHRASR